MSSEQMRPNTLGGATLSASQVARQLNVSIRHIRRMDAAGRLPRPVRFGRCVRWLTSDVDAWLAAGAPERKKWDSMKGCK